MIDNTMRVKLFTHTDLDGVGCAILAKCTFDNSDIVFCDYSDIDSAVSDFLPYSESYDYIFITDISISEELAAKIDSTSCTNIRLLDHHPSSLQLNKYKWVTARINESESSTLKTSGTALFYEELSTMQILPNYASLERFVEAVRDYDTWRWADLGEYGRVSKKLNDLLYIYGRDRFIAKSLNNLRSQPLFPNFDDIDELLLTLRSEEIDRYVDGREQQMVVRIIGGYTCGIVFADRFISQLGNTLCKRHPEIDIAVMLCLEYNTVSYRTVKDDVNLTEFAQQFGGGGHAKASGSPIPVEIRKEFVDTLFKQ